MTCILCLPEIFCYFALLNSDMAIQRTRKLPVIGATDKVDLPEFGLENIPCKIDTGADTSAIHCDKVRIVEKDGKEYLTFKLLDKRFAHLERKMYRFSQFKEKLIRNSFGDTEYRYAIQTSIVLFGKAYPITFTLSNRGQMKYPILIGKRFLRKKFLVDVSRHELSFSTKG